VVEVAPVVGDNQNTKKGTSMKFIKLAVVTLFAAALLAGSALAAEEKSCCEKAKAEGKDCTHECCVKAKKDGKVCEKCNPKKADKAEDKK
jgi:hypothetical protein